MFENLVERIAEKAAEKMKGLTETAYAAGYEARYTACAFKDREDQNRRLEEMYRMGKEQGKEEVRAEIGEIDDSWFEAIVQFRKGKAE